MTTKKIKIKKIKKWHCGCGRVAKYNLQSGSKLFDILDNGDFSENWNSFEVDNVINEYLCKKCLEKWR